MRTLSTLKPTGIAWTCTGVWPRDNRTDYIKRIIGLPGDRIQVRESVLYVNGEPVKREQVGTSAGRVGGIVPVTTTEFIETLPGGESHRIQQQTDAGLHNNTAEFLVPPGHYFAMGDNRDQSSDSRVTSSVGFVPAENLIGRAEIIFFSADGDSRPWEIWRWPTAIRWPRFFKLVD